MLKIVLLVLVVMTLFLWLLALLGAGPVGTYAGWLAFFAVAVLAAAVFLDGGLPLAR